MCDPLTIAGIALTGASVAANSVAQSKVESARNDALAAERIRQQGLQHESEAANAADQAKYKDIAGQQDKSSKTLGDYFQDQTAAEAPTGTVAAANLPPSSSNIVNQEVAKQNAKADAFSDQQANALGTLRSFGDVLGGLNRGTARTSIQIGQLGDFSRGSNAVLPFELDAANHAGDGLKTFGDLLGGFGSLGLNAGLSGKSLSLPFGGSSVKTVATPTVGSAIGSTGLTSIPANAALRLNSPYR